MNRFLCVLATLLTAVSAQGQTPAQTTTDPTNGVVVVRQGTDTYAAKFICGVQQDRDVTHVVDAQAGRYASKINVHNNTGMVINFRKKIIRLRGGEIPIAPAP